MKIGIIGAMEVEMNLIIDEIENVETISIMSSTYYQGFIDDVEVVLVKSGIGKVNASIAATVLIREFGCNYIINTGIAGATKPLCHRDIIISESVSYNDFDLRFFGYPFGQVPELPIEFVPSIDSKVMIKSILNKLNIKYKEAKIYSGDMFVTSMDQLSNIKNNEGIALEMEGAGIAHTCVKGGVDFIIIRYISDVIGEKSQEEYSKFEEDMANISAEILIKVIKNLE